MSTLKRILREFAHDEQGATAIEYGLVTGLIAVVIIGAVKTTGTRIGSRFQAVSGNMT